MNRLRTVLFLFCVVCVPSVSHAQIPATQNIVTVSFNAAVLQTTEAQKELSALQTRFGPRQAQIQALNTEVEALRKQLNDTGDKLSETERATREQSLDRKEKQLQRQAEDVKADSQTESQQVFQRIAQKFYAFLQVYSQQHNYSAVIERGSDAAPVVWYAASNLDITEQITKAYNAQSGTVTGTLPPAPNPGAAAKPAKSVPESSSPPR